MSSKRSMSLNTLYILPSHNIWIIPDICELVDSCEKGLSGHTIRISICNIKRLVSLKAKHAGRGFRSLSDCCRQLLLLIIITINY